MIALAARRLWRHRALAAAQLVAVAAVVAVATAIALVSAGAADAGLRSLLAASPSASTVLIEAPDLRSTASLERFQASTAAQVTARVGGALAPAGAFGRLSDITVATLNGQPTSADTGTPAVADFPDLRRHARLVAGAWPSGPAAQDAPIPVAVRDSGATALGVRAGDVYCFEATDLKPPPWPSFCTRIAAIWRPGDERDPYWWTGPSEFDLVADASDYFALAGGIGNAYAVGGVAYAVVPSAVTADRADALLTGMRRLRARYTVETNGIFISGLDSSLSVFVQRSRVDAFTVELLGTGLLLVAAYAAAFLGGHFLAAQEPGVALLRVRGWTRRRAWLLLVGEFCLLALPALPLGAVAGAVASRAVLAAVAGGGAAVSFDGQADLVPVATSLLLPLVVLAALAAETSRRSILEIRRALSRPPTLPWWRWRHLDLALGLLSIPLLGEARLRGSAEVRAAQADDPVALLLPGIAIACLALVSLRLLPLVSRICRLAPRNVSALLAWWHLSRQPGEHAGLAVLVSLAVALGLFAGVYSTTERQAVVDRAAYAAGADLRATFDAGTPPGHVEAVAAQLPDVTRSTGVQRETAFIGYHLSQATLLGVDEGDFARTAWSRADVSTSAALRQLAAADPDGAPLADGADTLTVSAVSPGLDAVLLAELVNGSGERRVVRLGDLSATGPVQFRAPLGGLALGHDVRLRSLTISPTSGNRHRGRLLLSGTGRWIATGGLLPTPYYPQDAGDGASLAVPVEVSSANVTLYPVPTLKPIPVLLSRSTAETLGLRIGYRMAIQAGEYADTAVVVGLVDYVPTFYPGQDDFMIAPLAALRARFAAAGFPVDHANELWADVRGDGAAAARLLNADRNVTSVDSRSVRAAQGLADPLLLELDANLRIGFAAALLLAVVGFAVHFLITSRRRVADSAILRANGLPAGVVRRGLAAEQLVLLLFSVGIGAVLGGVLAYALLPGLELSTSVSDRVPPTLTTFDPGALFLAVGGVVAAALLLAWAAGRGSTVDAVAELRTLG